MTKTVLLVFTFMIPLLSVFIFVGEARALPPQLDPDKLSCQMEQDIDSTPSIPLKPGEPAPPPDIRNFHTILIGSPTNVVVGDFDEFDMEGDGYKVHVTYLARNIHVSFYDSSGKEVSSWTSGFTPQGVNEGAGYANNHTITCHLN